MDIICVNGISIPYFRLLLCPGKGLTCGFSFNTQIDGIWGAGSKAATVSFQRDNALEADGIFGTQTIATSTEIIKAIQKVITDGKIAIDGLAGLETKDAAVRCQAEHGLTPDGIAR